MEYLQIRINAILKQQVKEIAEKEYNGNISDYVRELLLKDIKDNHKLSLSQDNVDKIVAKYLTSK